MKLRTLLPLLFGTGCLTACDPDPQWDGIYFPGWLVSLFLGIVAAYLGTWPWREALGSLLDLWRICLTIIISVLFYFLLFAD